MGQYSRTVGGKTVFLQCDERLEAAAGMLLSALEQEAAVGFLPADGKRVQVGWGFYRFRREGEGFRLLTPDLLRDPFADEIEDLSLTLSIFACQCIIMNETKAPASPTVTFQDRMVIKKTAVKASRVYLQRQRAAKQGDSGWYLGTIGESRSDDLGDYKSIETYRLLFICRGALQLLQLPVGTVAVLEGGKLVEAVDGENRKLL